MEKNGTFLLKNGKERNVPNGKERGAQPWLKFPMTWSKLNCIFLLRLSHLTNSKTALAKYCKSNSKFEIFEIYT